MASILRQIVAGPRIRHEETGLDLVYVTDNIIAMSMPAAEYPKMAYRNPIKKVVEFLDKEHQDNWAVWEFRAEGTGYDDATFHDRVFHSPWPDHHPPPFGLIPNIMASMRNHLKQGPEKVCVVHCKAGKGRTGTVTCSYLISQEGWSKADALERFTKKRMRPQFGAGVSIPSQLRYIDYVTQWVSPKYNRVYIERAVEVTEIHLWGLREGVKLAVIGYVNEGKVMKVFHTFDKSEKTVVDDKVDAVIFKPKNTVNLATNDICIDFEKRSKAKYGWTFVSALAHCWFNAYFEGDAQSGVFTQEWDGMDGLRGTSKKGTRIFDKMSVVWQVIYQEKTIHEPSENEPVIGTQKVDAPQPDLVDEESNGRDIGLRLATVDDADLESLNTQSVEGESSVPGSGTHTPNLPHLITHPETTTHDSSISTSNISNSAWTTSTSASTSGALDDAVMSPTRQALSPDNISASPVPENEDQNEYDGLEHITPASHSNSGLSTSPERKVKKVSLGTLKKDGEENLVS